MVNFDDYSDEELEELITAATAEFSVRKELIEAPAKANSAARRYRMIVERDNEPGDPAPWVQPTGAHDAYPEGWAVSHSGAYWVSTTPANVWEPGVTGWREETDTGGGVYPEWKQPLGYHDAYQIGFIVTYGGNIYESVLDNNVWAPEVAGWSRLNYDPIDPDDPVDPDDPDEEPQYPDWKQPAGAHDAYAVGDRVMHNGKAWESTASGNAWEPGVYGWEEI